jgi:hypothetical protein
VIEFNHLLHLILTHMLCAEDNHSGPIQVYITASRRGSLFDNVVVGIRLDPVGRTGPIKVLGARFDHVDDLLEVYALDVCKWNLAGRSNENIGSGELEKRSYRRGALGIERQNDEGKIMECARCKSIRDNPQSMARQKYQS